VQPAGQAEEAGGDVDQSVYHLERIGDGKEDQLVAKGGRDLVLANKYTADTDVVMGGGGSDRINVADGDKLDTANGGKDGDICIVDARGKRAPVAQASMSNARKV
jgi:hypothetical protein